MHMRCDISHCTPVSHCTLSGSMRALCSKAQNLLFCRTFRATLVQQRWFLLLHGCQVPQMQRRTAAPSRHLHRLRSRHGLHRCRARPTGTSQPPPAMLWYLSTAGPACGGRACYPLAAPQVDSFLLRSWTVLQGAEAACTSAALSWTKHVQPTASAECRQASSSRQTARLPSCTAHLHGTLIIARRHCYSPSRAARLH